MLPYMDWKTSSIASNVVPFGSISYSATMNILDISSLAGKYLQSSYFNLYDFRFSVSGFILVSSLSISSMYSYMDFSYASNAVGVISSIIIVDELILAYSFAEFCQAISVDEIRFSMSFLVVASMILVFSKLNSAVFNMSCNGLLFPSIVPKASNVS